MDNNFNKPNINDYNNNDCSNNNNNFDNNNNNNNGQPVPPNAYGQPVPPNTYGQPVPPNAYGQPVPPNAYGQPVPPNTYGQPVPPNAYGQPVPPNTYGQPVPPEGAQQAGVPIPPGFTPGYGYNQGINPQAYMQGQFYPPNEEPQSNCAVASLIVGIASIVGLCCYGFGFVLGIIAIVLALVSRNETGKLTSVAMGGFIMGIISCTIGICIFFIVMLTNSFFWL